MQGDNLEFIRQYLDEVREIIDLLPRERINDAIELLFDAWKKGKTVYAMGNGGSASTATCFAADLAFLNAGNSAKSFRSFSLTDPIPLVSAWTNDYGFDSVYKGQLTNVFEEGDVLVGFSVHGGGGSGQWSGNLGQAYRFAKQSNGKTVGLAGFDGGDMKRLCDVSITVPVNSTPHTEAFHVVIEQLIVSALAEKMQVETTKQASDNGNGLWAYSFHQHMQKYFEGAISISSELSRTEIDHAIEMFFDIWKESKTVYFMGTGTRLGYATHFSGDLSKTTMSEDCKRFRSFSLGDCGPLASAWIYKSGPNAVFKSQLENALHEGDLVVGIGLGNEQDSDALKQALTIAKTMGARTLLIAGDNSERIFENADGLIRVPSANEFLVNSYHQILQHLIIFSLKEKISKEGKNQQ